MTVHYADDWLTVLHGDVRDELRTLPDESVHCVVTSPPYWGLRDYGDATQLGLEPTPEQYVENMVAVFREVRRVLRSDGTLWLNLGDSYNNRRVTRPSSHQGGLGFTNDSIKTSWAEHTKNGTSALSINGGPYSLKEKDLVGIPWRVAFALQADGWYLRSDIIWSKPNPMPESVTDRPTKSHEYLFLLSKSARYYFDADAVREPSPDNKNTHWRASKYDSSLGTIDNAKSHRSEVVLGRGEPTLTKNIRSVWTIATAPYPGAHFATFPPKLVEPCIKAGCPPDGVVLDPFAGSGTTGMVAQSLSRRAVLIDLNVDYLGQLMERNREIPLGLEAS